MRFITLLVLLATLLLWSGNWVVARGVRDDIAPGIATGCRLALVLAILLPLTWRGLRAKLPALGRADWLLLAALGFAGGGVHMAMQWLGMHYTTATSGILYLSSTPVFILLFALPLGERLRPAQLAGVAISFAGVATIAAQGSAANLAALSFNRGDMLALGSMVMFGGYTVLLRVRRLPLDTVEVLAMVCLFGLAFMLPWIAWDLALADRVQPNTAALLAIAYSAVGSQLLAYLGWSHVVQRLGASLSGITLHLMPAMGVLLSALFLHEYPEAFHFAGIALILAGVALSSRRGTIASSSTKERTQ